MVCCCSNWVERSTGWKFPLSLQVFDNESNRTHMIYTANEETANWMRFVRQAKSSLVQNIVAFQQGADIYFITNREIQRDTELLYWFSKDTAQLLGALTAPVPQANWAMLFNAVCLELALFTSCFQGCAANLNIIWGVNFARSNFQMKMPCRSIWSSNTWTQLLAGWSAGGGTLFETPFLEKTLATVSISCGYFQVSLHFVSKGIFVLFQVEYPHARSRGNKASSLRDLQKKLHGQK